MLSVSVCGGHLPTVPVVKSQPPQKRKSSPPVVTFPFFSPCLSHSTFDLHHCLTPTARTCTHPFQFKKTKKKLLLAPCRARYFDILFDLLLDACNFFFFFVVVLLFLCLQNLLSVFQLNVQIVNNTAATLFCSLHVCLEEQQSSKAFTKPPLHTLLPPPARRLQWI